MRVAEHRMEEAEVQGFMRNVAPKIAAGEIMIINVENLKYSYTIGHTPAVPELIISGFDTEFRFAALGRLTDPFRENGNRSNTIRYGNLEFACRDVKEEKARDLADMAFLFYQGTQHTVRLTQIVYPDFCGSFPWDKRVHPSLRRHQENFWQP